MRMRMSRHFDVETADNGLLALEKVKQRVNCYFDAIVMDINMPIMDGFEAAEKISTYLNSHVMVGVKSVCPMHTPEQIVKQPNFNEGPVSATSSDSIESGQ